MAMETELPLIPRRLLQTGQDGGKLWCSCVAANHALSVMWLTT